MESDSGRDGGGVGAELSGCARRLMLFTPYLGSSHVEGGMKILLKSLVCFPLTDSSAAH